MTAGAHQLKEGQKVRLLSDVAPRRPDLRTTTLKPDAAKKG